MDVTVPGGTGWKTNRKRTSFRFKNAAGFEGIRAISLKTSPRNPGRVAFRVVGGNVGFGDSPALPVKATLVLDAPVATTGQCGETNFPPAGCKRNKKGNKVTCR